MSRSKILQEFMWKRCLESPWKLMDFFLRKTGHTAVR